MRSDATENRISILEVARTLFLKFGPDLSMSAIAKEAKLSRATLYRNFHDKQDLVVALVHYNLEALENFAIKIKEKDDGFFQLLHEAAKQQSQFQGLIPYLPKEKEDIEERIFKLFEVPVNRAKKAGLIEPDFDVLSDSVILITMLGNIYHYSYLEKDIGFVQRSMEIIRKGIR